MENLIWISHRGYHQNCLENTIQAFDAAVEAGFSSLELDLRSTADGHIILQHDKSLERSCGISKNIGDLRLTEIRRLRTRDEQSLLTFDEFMSRYAGCSWIFDIKPESDLQTLHILKRWAHRKNAESWLNSQARFLLWTQRAKKLAWQLFPGIANLAGRNECYQAGIAVLFKVPGLAQLKSGRTYSLPRYFMGRDLFTPTIVQAYHRRGARVLAYLPEAEADTLAAVAAGFDEILTNGRPIDHPERGRNG